MNYTELATANWAPAWCAFLLGVFGAAATVYGCKTSARPQGFAASMAFVPTVAIACFAGWLAVWLTAAWLFRAVGWVAFTESTNPFDVWPFLAAWLVASAVCVGLTGLVSTPTGGSSGDEFEAAAQ